VTPCISAKFFAFDIVALITDQTESNAKNLAEMHGVTYHCQPAGKLTPRAREVYFQTLALYLRKEKITCLIYAGFMKLVTHDFLTEFPGINSHPADLRVVDEHGNRKYIGAHGVQRALDDGAKSIRCTCHMIDDATDGGFIIALSHPIHVRKNEKNDPNALQARLKKVSEWLYLPDILAKLAGGKLELRQLPYLYP